MHKMWTCLARIQVKGKIKVLVKPNSAKNAVLGYDEIREAWKIDISAPAKQNKANLELVKFLSKKTGKKVRFLSGLRSKEKILFIPE